MSGKKSLKKLMPVLLLVLVLAVLGGCAGEQKSGADAGASGDEKAGNEAQAGEDAQTSEAQGENADSAKSGEDASGENSGEGNESDEQGQSATDENSEVGAGAATRVVTDQLGRKVEIPTKIERIASHGDAARLLVYLGLADKIVGIPDCCKNQKGNPMMAYAYVNMEKWADLPVIGSNSFGAKEWYPEEIIACNPDVLICSYDKELADTIQEKTGIPVISFPYNDLFSEEYNESLKFIGEICGASEKANKIVDYIHASIADFNERTKDAKDETKPSFLAAAATHCGGHSIDWIYSKAPVLTALHINNVATGLAERNTGTEVDKEKVLMWNPEIIFLDAGNVKLVRDDYAENTDYFNELQAVKNDNVYQWPNSTWHYSNVEIPLVTGYYLGSVLYPEEFKDINFDEKAAEIFELFIGDKDYMKKLDEIGAGYSKVKLGE